METLILKVDTIANANLLAAFLKTVKPVKSIVFEKNNLKSQKEVVKETYNWINPTRSASEEEIDELCKIMDKDEGGVKSDILLKRGLLKLNKCLKK